MDILFCCLLLFWFVCYVIYCYFMYLLKTESWLRKYFFTLRKYVYLLDKNNYPALMLVDYPIFGIGESIVAIFDEEGRDFIGRLSPTELKQVLAKENVHDFDKMSLHEFVSLFGKQHESSYEHYKHFGTKN